MASIDVVSKKILQAFTQGLNFGDKKLTDKFKQTLSEATSAQQEGGDIIDTFLSDAGLAALVTPGGTPYPTSVVLLYVDTFKAWQFCILIGCIKMYEEFLMPRTYDYKSTVVILQGVVFVAVCAILPHEHNFDHRHFHVNGVNVPYWRALTGYVAPFSVTGNPVVTMPLCTIDGKPLGIQVQSYILWDCSNVK